MLDELFAEALYSAALASASLDMTGLYKVGEGRVWLDSDAQLIALIAANIEDKQTIVRSLRALADTIETER